VLPSLLIDGATVPVLHVSQIAEALGLPASPSGHPLQVGEEAAAILDAWFSHMPELGWDELIAATPSRGRSLRNLTVNVFHPFELLPRTWQTGEFDWWPEDDEAREHRLVTRDDVLSFAAERAAGWRSFLDAHGAELGYRNPPVSTPRGAITFSALLASQRWHAAYHYRQLVDIVRVPRPLDLTPFALALPDQVY